MFVVLLALVIVQVVAFRQQCTFTTEQGIAAEGKLCGCLCGDFCFASADNELGAHELFRYRVDTGECGTDDRTSRCGRNSGSTIAAPNNDNFRIDKQFEDEFLCREVPAESLRESFFCNSPYNGADAITLAPVKFSIFPAFSGELFATERIDECCFGEYCNECTPDAEDAVKPNILNPNLKCTGTCPDDRAAAGQLNGVCREPTREPTPVSVVEPRADIGCASSFSRLTLQLHSCAGAPVQLCIGFNATLRTSGEIVHVDTWGGDLDALGDLELINANGTGDYQGRHIASLVHVGEGAGNAPADALYHLKLMHIDANRQPLSTIDLHVLQTSNDSEPIAPGAGGVLRFALQKTAQPQHLRLSQNALLLHPDLGEKNRLVRSDVERDSVLPDDCDAPPPIDAQRKRQLTPSTNNSGEFFLDTALPLLEQAETSLLVRLTEASVLAATARKRGRQHHNRHGHRYQGGSSSSGAVDDDDDDSSDARRGCRRAAGSSSSSNGRLCFAKDYYLSLHNTGAVPAVALVNVTVRVRVDEFDAAFVDAKTSGVVVGGRTFVEGPRSELRWLVPQVLPGGIEELRLRVEQTTHAPRMAASVLGDVRGCFVDDGAIASPCNVLVELLDGTELQHTLTGSFFRPAHI